MRGMNKRHPPCENENNTDSAAARPITGHKGGRSAARTPVEASDSLHSVSFARVLDLISEGEIAGPVDGLRSVYLDGTPLMDAHGRMNFERVLVQWRAGTPLQEPIAGFPSSERTVQVQKELTSEQPYIYTASRAEISALVVTLGVNGLSSANPSNGDIGGHTIEYTIEVQSDGGAWQEAVRGSFSGKTTSTYRRSHRVDLPRASRGHTLRVRRITPNARTARVQDMTVIDSISEVIDAQLRYPMSALVGISFDARQFKSIPQRAYHVRGRIIRVPSNYDPESRRYEGLWDGTFKSAYSNNPAWVFFDLCTNDRYGLGRSIPAHWVDKWALYRIGRYCDEPVSDGAGGTEPRFTCNLYLQTRADAHRVLQDLCSIFRGMCYWGAGAVVATADMPRDPVMNFTQANVIDGQFSYTGTRGRDRYTVALVSYNDMSRMGRAQVVYVQDAAAVAKYGIRSTEVSAFGCTSAAQAQRLGRWILATAQRETRSVSFRVGLDGDLVAPGSVISVADNLLSGLRLGGRLRTGSTAQQLRLDAPAPVKAGDAISVNMPSGQQATRTIAAVHEAEGVMRVILSQPLDAEPAPDAVWTATGGQERQVHQQLYTVISVAQSEGLTFEITAVQHEPAKFAAVETGAPLPAPAPITGVDPHIVNAPQWVRLRAQTITDEAGNPRTTVTIAWSEVQGARAYNVQFRRSALNWVTLAPQMGQSCEIDNALSGHYTARVAAVSLLDTASAWTESEVLTVSGRSEAPPALEFFDVSEGAHNVRRVRFGYIERQRPPSVAGAQIRVLAGLPEFVHWDHMTPLGGGDGFFAQDFDTQAPEAGSWTFAARAVSRDGVLSDGMQIIRKTLRAVGVASPDLTPPAAPTGLVVASTGAAGGVLVQWDSPSYEAGHGLTRIWAAPFGADGHAPEASAAVRVAEASTNVCSFTLATASGRYRVWAAHVSRWGVEGGRASADVQPLKVGDIDLSEDINIARRIASGAITGDKLAAGAIHAGSAAIAAAAIDDAHISRLHGGKIIAGTITAAQIQAGAISSDKIQTGAIRSDQIQAGAITSDKISAGGITTDKIQANAITGGHIQAGAINSDKIQAGAITSDKIQAGAITAQSVRTDVLEAARAHIEILDNCTIVSGETGAYWRLKYRHDPRPKSDPRIDMRYGNAMFSLGGQLIFSQHTGLVINAPGCIGSYNIRDNSIQARHLDRDSLIQKLIEVFHYLRSFDYTADRNSEQYQKFQTRQGLAFLIKNLGYTPPYWDGGA